MKSLWTFFSISATILSFAKKNNNESESLKIARDQADAAWAASRYARKSYKLAWLSALLNVFVLLSAFGIAFIGERLRSIEQEKDKKNWQHLALIAGISTLRAVEKFTSEDGPLDMKFCSSATSMPKLAQNFTEAGSIRLRSYVSEAFNKEKPEPLTVDAKIKISNILDQMDDIFSEIKFDVGSKVGVDDRMKSCKVARKDIYDQAGDLRETLFILYDDQITPVYGLLWKMASPVKTITDPNIDGRGNYKDQIKSINLSYVE